MTKLDQEEWDRLEFLLAKDHVVDISQAEMDEIDHLVKRQYPEKELKFKNKKELIDFAIVIVCDRLTMRHMRLVHPPDTFLHPEKVYADVYSLRE